MRIFFVIISFNNGGNNYGVKRQGNDGKRDVFNVCGYSESNRNYSNGWTYASTLVHEFNHSFVNPLIDNNANYALIKDASNWMLKLSKWSMSYAQAYSNGSTVMNESLVRAAVLIYLQENGFTMEQIKDQMYDEISRGFTWMPELFTALKYYTAHRDQYKTLNDYYPEIAKVLNEYVAKERARIDQTIGMQTIETEVNGVKMTFSSYSPTSLMLESATLTQAGTVTIPDEVNGLKVAAIGPEVFRNKKLLSGIVFPRYLEYIGRSAFIFSRITKVDLPATLKEIGSYAFAATNLETLSIPASVTKIGDGFMANCQYLSSVVVDENNSVYDSRDKCNAVIETATNTLFAGCGTTIIPQSVHALGDYSFRENQYLKSFTIPEWITSIGSSAFMYCTKITKMTSNIKSPFEIDSNVFHELPSNAVLYVPKGTKTVYQSTVGWNVFSDIIEFEPSSVRGITPDTQQPSRSYSLNGRRVNESTLRPGIYIKNRKKIVIK